MTAATLAPDAAQRRMSPARLVAAALAAGAVDLVYATVAGGLAGRSFQKVWQSVAGGWIGRQAGELGWASAALGLLTHFGIAAAMTGVYAAAARQAPVLRRRPWLGGALYGLGLYAVMYRVVLPLRWPQAFPRWDGPQSVADVAAHVGVGLAIALVLSRPGARTPSSCRGTLRRRAPAP